jgi:molybdopterin synthase sulfur carrier subunit
MAKTIHIPTPLQKLCENQARLETTTASVAEALDEIFAHYPAVEPRLMDEKGRVRKSLNIYVNEEDIRFLENLRTELKEGDEMTILPAISGG